MMNIPAATSSRPSPQRIQVPIDLTVFEKAASPLTTAPRMRRGQILDGRRTLRRFLEPLNSVGEAPGPSLWL